MNNEYSLRFSKSISNTAKGFLFCCVVFCFVWCFGFVYFFSFVLLFLLCFVRLFVFPIQLKSWNEWCSHTKTSKLLRKWEIQNGGSDLAPQLLGEYIILQVLLDRGHDFFWIFFKVTKTLLGVIHKGWGLKSFLTLLLGGWVLNKNYQKFSRENWVYLYDLLWGWPIIFMSKRGALKYKYNCAVHSNFYCFASADICRHGL